jgi:axial budding pattern protein 2
VPVPNPDAGFTGNRIASQRAKVCKTGNGEDTGIKASNTADDLSMGLHYVRSLGTDQPATNNGGGNGSSLSNIRSSFTSLESSHMGYKTGTELSVTKVLTRVGERFKFRVPIFPTTGTTTEGYVVKLISGQALPKFIQPDLSGVSTKGVLGLSGLATFRDVGTLSVGVYTNTGVCVANVVIEVVGK